jgi:hypothetical protein
MLVKLLQEKGAIRIAIQMQFGAQAVKGGNVVKVIKLLSLSVCLSCVTTPYIRQDMHESWYQYQFCTFHPTRVDTRYS